MAVRLWVLIVALTHDVIIVTIGVFRASWGSSSTLSTVAAVLTIAGYSINDTVVVFDRVREKAPEIQDPCHLPELLNFAINQARCRGR